MKLTIEETKKNALDNGTFLFTTTVADVRHVSITDTKGVAFIWWEQMDGQKCTFKEQERKPARIVLEFGEEETDVSDRAIGLSMLPYWCAY